MNIFLPAPPTHASAMDGQRRWKKLGTGVIAGFTWKELIVTMLLAIVLLEFIHY